MKKCIVLCADDYGQAEAISRGIITLIQYGRLSAVSCLTNSPHWEEQAAWLKPYQHQVDIGLHFNLTQGLALSGAYIKRYGKHFAPLGTVLRKAFLKQLDLKVIEAEFEAQLTAFESAAGFSPQFIDGHQHVHQFPIVREAVINIYKKRFTDKNVYMRCVKEPVKWMDIFTQTKKWIIQITGAKPFKTLLMQENIPHNHTFAGIYNFSQANDYQSHFKKFLAQIEDRGIIMCHPGLKDKKESTDPISTARDAEFRYLFSGKFLEDCMDEEAMIRRFNVKSQAVSQTAQEV